MNLTKLVNIVKENVVLLSKLTNYTFLPALFQGYYSGIGSILCFHRVTSSGNENVRIGNNKGLEASQDFLEKLINYFIDNNYEILSLDNIYNIIKNREVREKKFVSFTFDDGFKDNYILGYPIFKKYNLPFTVYVTVNYPEYRINLWNYIIEDIARDNTAVKFMYKREIINLNAYSTAQKENAFYYLKNLIINMNLQDFEEFFFKLCGDYKIDLDEYRKKFCLSWDDIKIMSEDKNVTIGSHTLNHLSLKKLDIHQMEYEVNESNKIIEKHISKKVEHFSYPFGTKADAGEREFNFIRQFNYKTAVTGRIGNIFYEHAAYLECLPRIQVSGYFNEDITPLKILLSGLPSCFINKFKRIDVS